MSDILALQLTVLVCGTVVLVSSLRFFRRYLELKHARNLSESDAMLQDRLGRMELNVDAIAVEVERISESNRFVAKLLAERGASPAVLPSPPRVITPH